MTAPLHLQKAVAPLPKPRFDARSYVIRGEDPAQLEALATGYFEQFQPHGPVERLLVETMILAEWIKHRWSRLETQLLNEAPSPIELLKDPAANKLLRQVVGRVASEDRRWFRSLAELRRLQKQRAIPDPALQPQENKSVAENWVCSDKSSDGHPPTPAPAAARHQGPIPYEPSYGFVKTGPAQATPPPSPTSN